MIQTLSDTFTPVLWGCVLALLLNLPLRAIERQLPPCSPRVRRALGLVLVLCGFAAILFLGLWLLIPQLAVAVANIGATLPSIYSGLESYLTALAERFSVGDTIFSASVFSTARIEAVGENAMSKLMNLGVAAASYTARQLVRFVLALVLAVYLLASKENLAHKANLLVRACLGNVRGGRVLAVCHHASEAFASFMVGQCLEAGILAGLFVLALLFAGMPYVLPVATLIGVTAFVPVFGSMVGCVLGFLLIASTAPAKALWFLLVFAVVQQLENNIIYPRVVGRRLGLPPLWVIIAVMVGGGLFGLPGLFLGIPAMSVFYQLGGEWVHARTAAPDKKTSPQTPPTKP